IFTIYKLFSWIYDKMVDFRRICYLLKSPDFDRKVGGHAPDYPKRQSKGKNLNYNSGNYWGLRLLTNFKEIESKNIYRIDDISFDFGPTWGIQRAYGKMHLLFDMGPVYYFDTKGNSGFFPIMLQLNLGFNAKKW
ncbi:hypothetical protein, partial [Anaerorudis cellulosivorans]|uniref:hypothetical protein n=1 Tax=Anaerorudis cellulosivorans TaxID=3397862 RepID=UPI00221F4903